jgi:hypothetical protein
MKDMITRLREFGALNSENPKCQDIGRMKTLEEAERILIQPSGSVFRLRRSRKVSLVAHCT